MKSRFKLAFSLFALIAMLMPLDIARAAPVQTRASHLGAIAVGMGKIMHMADYLRDYPGCRTAILCYLKLDSMDVSEMVRYMRIHAAIQESMRRDFWPQIAIETVRLNLAEFHRELSHRGSLIDQNVRMLAREIARYRDRQKWFFIRPFSEMNDGTEAAPWEFGNTARHNTSEDFAAAWKLLRETFDQEGATNAIFIFSPLAAHNVHHESQVLAALNLIPVGYIDAYGLNVYSRPGTAYGGCSAEPISFAELAQPWLKLLAGSKQHGIPLAVAEMGVSNQASDAQRAKWLRDAFGFAKTHGYVMVTYFNYPHRYWQIDEQTLAGEALKAGMEP